MCDAPTGLRDQQMPSPHSHVRGGFHGDDVGVEGCGVRAPPCWPERRRVTGPRGPGTGCPFVSAAPASDGGRPAPACD